MRGVFRWLWRIVSVAAVVAVAVLVVYIAAAPGIARSRILAALDDMGIPNASIEVRSVTTGHVIVNSRWLNRNKNISRCESAKGNYLIRIN